MGLGEKKQTVMQYNSQGLALSKALAIAKITKHQYYYQSKAGKPGAKTSCVTALHTGLSVENTQVVAHIKQLHEDPDLAYGYHGTTKALQQAGFVINHKKVYRLMKENNLLKDKKNKTAKTYVKFRKVMPCGPLEVLEMDIKMVWVEREKRHAFILNILDTFTRKWLYWLVSFSITQHEVKQAWEYIITQYLQPNDMLKKQVHIEIRNDNDKRFSAKMVQDFFQENHLNQVFTHPYTPQENGHVESFHAILGRHLKRFCFWSLSELDQNLSLFQNTYNNERLHGSIAHLTPNDFEQLWHLHHLQMSSNLKKRTIVFQLKIPRHRIKQHTGKNEPKGSSLLDLKPLDEAKIEKQKMTSADTSYNKRYKKSPAVVPCKAKVNTENRIFEIPKC